MSTNLDNAKIFYEFLISQHNQNIKFNTIITYVKVLSYFIEYSHNKDFETTTKNEIVDFLNTVRKDEQDDPSHKWIGTYNNKRMLLSKFFRWIYNQYKNNETDPKKWVTSLCMQGIKQLPRKEKSTYKSLDMWTDEDHALFLNYCPDKRDRCYHAMANDTSARPSELLNLKIKDIQFKVSSTNMQYAIINITQSKTKPRTLSLIHSIPYVKEWLDSHPLSNNPDAFHFITLSDRNFGKRLSEQAIHKQYSKKYKKNYFPKLIDDNIPERDKSLIKNLLTKPWNPYIQGHSALTSKSVILKEHILRDHAGWTLSSKMPELYIHYLSNESTNSLLEAFGIEDNSKKGQSNLLKSKPCPNCNEPNKHDGKFCSKCKMLLTFDSYQETLEREKEKDLQIEKIQQENAQIRQALNTVLDDIKKFTTDLRNDKNHPLRKEIEKIIGDRDEEHRKKFEQLQKMFMISNKISKKVEEKILLKKGPLTEEEEEAIDYSVLEDIKQTDPDLFNLLNKLNTKSKSRQIKIQKDNFL